VEEEGRERGKGRRRREEAKGIGRGWTALPFRADSGEINHNVKAFADDS